MSSEPQNVHTVQQAYAAFRRGDVDGVLSFMTPDTGWFVPGPPDVLPFAGQRHGRDQIADFFAKLAEAQDVEMFESRDFIPRGDRVVALGEYRWHVKMTGRTFSSDFAHVFTLTDGKVTDFREFSDTAAAVRAYRP